MLLAVFGGSKASLLFELAEEMLRVFVAAGGCDLVDAVTAAAQQILGMADTAADQILLPGGMKKLFVKVVKPGEADMETLGGGFRVPELFRVLKEGFTQSEKRLMPLMIRLCSGADGIREPVH